MRINYGQVWEETGKSALFVEVPVAMRKGRFLVGNEVGVKIGIVEERRRRTQWGKRKRKRRRKRGGKEARRKKMSHQLFRGFFKEDCFAHQCAERKRKKKR